MFKKDLIRAVSDRTEWCEADAERAVNAVFGAIQDELRKGNKVQITRFGTFDAHTWQKHKINSIADGKKITIPKRKVATFRAGSDLKTAIKRRG